VQEREEGEKKERKHGTRRSEIDRRVFLAFLASAMLMGREEGAVVKLIVRDLLLWMARAVAFARVRTEVFSPPLPLGGNSVAPPSRRRPEMDDSEDESPVSLTLHRINVPPKVEGEEWRRVRS